MRLISKFRDYYDNQQKFDDPNDGLFIIRNTSDHEPFYGLNQGGDIKYGVIGFAGILYPFIEYPRDNIISFDLESFLNKYTLASYTKQSIIRHFDRFRDDAEKLFEKYGPIFVIDYTTYQYNRETGNYDSIITRNPKLKDYGFDKILYPHIAWNNLKNYVMNQARPLKPIPEMDDVTKAEIHGFNKFSFRKDKQ